MRRRGAGDGVTETTTPRPPCGYGACASVANFSLLGGPAAERAAYAVKMALTRWVGGPSRAVRALRTPRPARGFPAALRGPPRGAAAVRERAEGPRPLLGAGPPAGPRPRRVRQGPVGPGGALAGASVCPLGKALPLSPVHCGWKELLRLGWVRGVLSRFLHHQRGRAGFVTSCVSPRAWDCSCGGCPGIPSVSGYFLSKRTKGLYGQEELKRGSEEI